MAEVIPRYEKLPDPAARCHTSCSGIEREALEDFITPGALPEDEVSMPRHADITLHFDGI